VKDDNRETQVFGTGEAPAPIGPGSVLRGRYRLDSELGRGGMGVVYRAEDLDLRRDVAVKVLTDAASTPDARERLMREARSAAALNHPHIVAVHDVGEDRGVPFFVMELVGGPSLGAAPPSAFPEIVAVAIEICEALTHAHDHGIVHRDLKPENVLLAGGGPGGRRGVKLADLGLAVPTSGVRLTQDGAIVGTVAFMAPEQAMGQSVDGRADLYSLGVVLYELATGRLPFTGDHPLAVVSQHVNAPVVPPRAVRPSVPRGLEAVILRLLSKDPAQRYASAAETAEALRRALDAPASAADEEAPGAAIALLDALARGRLVGRAEELAEARELWRRAREGRGHGVLVSGEPGAGKTRLSREVLIQAALDGAIVLSGACYEYEAATPYLPFAEAFRRWAREQKSIDALRAILGDAAPQIAKLAPEIETRLGPFPERPVLPASEERLLFLDAVTRVFRAMAGARGLLFYVDDLHWADGGTLWLMGHLLRSLREERALLVASYREIELDRAHPLSKALVDWNRERLMTRIVLRRFKVEETRAQLSSLLGEEVGEEFAQALQRETEGNPFFIEEVLKALIEQGAVRRESGRWKREEIGDLQIPQSMKEAIGHRLDRISPACNDVLRAAAILGKTFDFQELVAAVGDKGEDALLDALDEAASAQLLAAGREDSFAFTHDKIREVLYEEMNPIRRRRLHLRTAEGLERHRGRAPVAVEKLAHHYIEAGEHERGLAFAREAGAEAERLHAYEDAIAAYGRAAECAEALGRQDEQAALEASMGKVCQISGNMIAGLDHFERALALTKDPRARASLQSMAAHSLVTVGDPRGLDYVREALAVLDPVHDPIDVAHARVIEARFHHLAGRHRKAVEILEGAMALVAPSMETERWTAAEATTILSGVSYLAGAYQHLGLFEESNRWARRSIEIGVARGIPIAEANGYEFLGKNTTGTGDWKDGLAYAAKEREIIATRIHSRERQAWTHLVASICRAELGETAEAEREFVEGIALGEELGEVRVVALLKAFYAPLLADLGRRDEALAIALQNLALQEKLGMFHMHLEAMRAVACVRFRRGELEQSLALCEEIVRRTEGKEPRICRLRLGSTHVAVLLAMGRIVEARAAHAVFADLVATCQSPSSTREVAHLAAEIEARARE